MSNIALYEVRDSNSTVYLYSHWGASLLSAGLHADQALGYFRSGNYPDQTLGTIYEHLNYDGEYVPDEQTRMPNVSRPFEIIEPSQARKLVKSIHDGEHTVQAFILIDCRVNQRFKYIENPSLSGETYSLSGSLSDLRKRAKACYNNLSNSGRIIDYSDMCRELRADIIRYPQDIQMFRSERLVNGYSFDMEHKCLKSVYIVESNVTTLNVNSIYDKDTLYNAMTQGEYRDFSSAAVLFFGDPTNARPLARAQNSYEAIEREISQRQMEYRCVQWLPFESEFYKRFSREICDKLEQCYPQRLLFLGMTDGAPQLTEVRVGLGEDITDKVSELLDRGEGVELKTIQGNSPDIIGFVNQRDAGKRGNPVVLASKADSTDGYYLSDEQITRLQQEFSRISQRAAPTQQQSQQNSEAQSESRRRR